MLSSGSGTRMIGYIRPDDKSMTPLVVAAREDQLLGFCVSVPSTKGEKQYFVDEEFLPELHKDFLLLYEYFHLKLTQTSSISKPKSHGVESDEELAKEQKEAADVPGTSIGMEYEEDEKEDQRHPDAPPPSSQILSENDSGLSKAPSQASVTQDSSPSDSGDKNAGSTPDVKPPLVLPKLRVRKDILIEEQVEVIDVETAGVAGVDTGMNLMRDCRFLIQEQQPSVVQHHRPRFPPTNTVHPPPRHQHQNQLNLRPRYLILPQRVESEFPPQPVRAITTQHRLPPRLGPLSAPPAAPRPGPSSGRWTGQPPGPTVGRPPGARPGQSPSVRPGPAPALRRGQPTVRSGLPLVIARSPRPQTVLNQQGSAAGNVENTKVQIYVIILYIHYYTT